MVTNVKPLLENAVTQPVQIDFWLRFGRLGNEANCCFFLLSPVSCGFLRADGASLKSADLYTDCFLPLHNCIKSYELFWRPSITHEFVCLFVVFLELFILPGFYPLAIEGWWVRWVWISVTLTSWSETKFYENLVNTRRRWCSNTTGVSNRRLRGTACSRQYFSTHDSLSLRHPDTPAVVFRLNDFCKFDLWCGNAHKSEVTSVGVCVS